MTYYNYTSEVHTVTTEQGYILTLVRCNTRKSCACKKKVAIIQHGLLGSSDEFSVNPPDQGLGKKNYYNGADISIVSFH